MSDFNTNTRAFTLIELAIVMVIIGLITGGIIGGRSMITAASRQGVVKEMNTVMTAVRNFQADYGKLPGLLYSPEEYFDITGCGYLQFGGYERSNTQNHLTKFLGRAKYGAFAEIYCAGYLENYSDKEIQRGFYLSDFVGQYGKYGANYQTGLKWKFGVNANRNKNALILSASSGRLTSNVISPVEAKWFDEKIDDGNPVRGNLLQIPTNAGAGNCYTAASQTYNLTVQESTCNFDLIIE